MTEKYGYWESLSEKIKTPGQTKNKRPDTSDLEREFILNYFNKSDEIPVFKNKPIILEFWATWCGSCVKAIPISIV